MFNATFTHVFVISGYSVLLTGDTRLPREKTELPYVTDKLYFTRSN